MMTSSITVTHDADPALRSQVQAVLRTYNAPFGVTTPDATPLVARATGPDGELVGGCVAETFWNWLVIDVLAVEEAAREQGIGSALVDAAEAEARSRGCTRVQTSAWAFQGLTFWTQRGYQVVGQLDDYPDGHTMCWLRRDL